jgi:nucleotide-binding universal stress UspA family protein
MFKQILVVTDFSPHSLKALSPAIFFAGRFKGTIHLCHVDEEEQALSAHSSNELLSFLELVESRRSSWLDGLANEVREHDVECMVVRLKGWASREIIEYGVREHIDLTAISALGGQGFKALLTGSTSANVLRNGATPTLFVGATCTPPEEFSVGCVLYPTDFSEPSLDGVAWAARLCKELGARLELYHVMKIPTFIPALPGEPPLALPTKLLDKTGLRFDELVKEALEFLPEEKITREVTLAQDEAVAISGAVVAKKADLVVIPRRGQGVLDGLVFGRVAENVAKLSPVPTLVFEPQAE